MPISLQKIVTYPEVAIGSKNGDDGYVAFGKINENNAVIVGAIEDAERKSFVLSCTDEAQTIEDRITALGGGNTLRTFRMPYAFVLLEVRASVNLPDSGGDIEIDIEENGVSIFSSGDSLVIPAGSKTSVGYSPAPDVRYVLLEDDNEITIERLTSPTGGIATGLNVTLIGYVIWTTF